MTLFLVGASVVSPKTYFLTADNASNRHLAIHFFFSPK